MSENKDEVRSTRTRVRRDRTQEILAAATKLFSEYGFKGTTLAMIAEAVGLTEPGILHYFPRKTSLLQGVLEYRDKKDFEKYAALLESEKKNFAELFELVEGVYAQDEYDPELVRLFLVLVGESFRGAHPSHDFFVDRYRRGREIYVEQLAALSETKIRSDVDTNELATLIMSVVDGLRIQWLLDPEQVDLTATFGLFSRIVVGYLEA